jgi:hypothetical protein
LCENLKKKKKIKIQNEEAIIFISETKMEEEIERIEENSKFCK